MEDSKPRYVRCPEALNPLFAQAEKQIAGFFERLSQVPEKGQVTISQERYILARAVTFSVELKQVLEDEYGRLAAEKIVYNLGRAAGTKDAEFFMEKLRLSKGPSALSAGPVHFAHIGWAFVDIFPESAPTMDEDYFLVYDHPYSFEAESFLNQGLKPERPVCHMNAGYSSAWCQVSFGVELTAKEISCRARGDAQCLFVMAHPSRINEYVVQTKDKYGIK